MYIYKKQVKEKKRQNRLKKKKSNRPEIFSGSSAIIADIEPSTLKIKVFTKPEFNRNLWIKTE